MFSHSIKKVFFSLLLTSFFCSAGICSFAQEATTTFPWTSNQVIEPATLAAAINADSSGELLILNTGPVNDIKGAVNIGPVEEKKNVRKLKRFLKNVPKDKPIIFYCGCCSMEICPNIVPAFEVLTKNGFTNFKILDIKENLSEEWIAKGYPMATSSDETESKQK